MEPNSNNYEVFRECLSSTIVAKSEEKPLKTPKRRPQRSKRRPQRSKRTTTTYTLPPPQQTRADPEDLAEFIDFLASETFDSFPATLQSLSYSTVQHDRSLSEEYSTPLPRATLDNLASTVPVSVADSLAVYGLIPDTADLPEFLNPVLSEYVAAATAAPPVWVSTRAEACEICERDWIPLSYHHLIPRGVHAKVLKKGWHDEWMLNSVAWLCRACHSFVHRMASNEELAREWFTVDRILERDDVQNWAKWVGRVRWKTR